MSLTTAIDALTGTAGNDIFNATHLTFNTGDVLVGGAGTDTLNIVNTGAGAYTAPAAKVSGIENIAVRNLSGSEAVTAVAGATAQKQVVKITVKTPDDTTDDVTVTFGTLKQVIGTSGGTDDAQAIIIKDVINALAGATIAAVGTGADAHIITVTAPVAGTPLPFIGFSEMTVSADAPTIAFTTPNIVAVTAVTGVAATTPSTMTVNATQFTDATTFKTDGSTGLVNFTGLTAAQTANMDGGSGGMGAGFGATVTAGTVNISGGTTAGNVGITGAALTTMTINSTGAANTIGTLTGAATTTGTTINAATALTTGAATNLGATVTITGAGNVSFGTTALGAGVTTVNASAMTGGLTVALGTAVTQTVTGGAGNDTITTGAILTTGSVNAGGGTDTLVVGAANHVNTAALAAKYTNFEIIRSAVDLDMSLISGITGLQVTAAEDKTFSKMSAAQASNVTLRGSQTTDVTFGVTGATNVGQIDTLALTISDGAAAVSTIIAGNISADGVENVTVNAIDNFTASSLDGLTAMTTLTVSGGGNVSLTSGALALKGNTVIDASAVTGTVTIDIDLSTANGAKIIGSATKANTITGSDEADIIIGGAGNDVINGGAGNDTINAGAGNDTVTVNTANSADTITLGAGSDTVKFSGGSLAAALATSSSADGVVKITDFVAGIDKIVIADTGGANTSFVLTAAQTIATAADLAAVYAGITAIAVSVDGGALTGALITVSAGAAAGTYLYVNDATAAVSNADDFLINLTGITGTLTTADVLFA